MKPKARPPKKAHHQATGADAVNIAEALLFDAHHDGDAAARLLLLVRALAYQNDATERENVAIQLEERIAVFVNGVDEAIDETLRRTLASFREGGAK